MSEYERLSDEELTDAISRIVVQLNQRLTMQFLSITEELIQYREKFINGQLVELPCKVDDTVYVVYDSCDGHNCPYNGNYGQWRCSYDGKMRCKAFVDEKKFQYSMLTEIGKTVFTTQEAAEARLKELQEGKK